MEIKKFGREEKVETTQKNEGGVVTPKKLSNESISILNDRLKDEYTAHYFYRNAANWCRNMNYKKAAIFLKTSPILN